jgi:site-specific DNA-methyltransferase (adenine-specific)
MGKFKVVLADPPWHFESWSEKGSKRHGIATAHYNTLNTDALCTLPVSDICADDCALFMWATWPNLPDALRVGAAWGFEYKTLGFDWLKRTAGGKGWHMGLGYWTRANSEPCLLFTRGAPKRRSQGVRQLIADVGQLELFPPIVEPVGVHSAKPFEAYTRIEALLDGPYIELFARIEYPGWTALGNEIDGLDIRDALALQLGLFGETADGAV